MAITLWEKSEKRRNKEFSCTLHKLHKENADVLPKSVGGHTLHSKYFQRIMTNKLCQGL